MDKLLLITLIWNVPLAFCWGEINIINNWYHQNQRYWLYALVNTSESFQESSVDFSNIWFVLTKAVLGASTFVVCQLATNTFDNTHSRDLLTWNHFDDLKIFYSASLNPNVINFYCITVCMQSCWPWPFIHSKDNHYTKFSHKHAKQCLESWTDNAWF